MLFKTMFLVANTCSMLAVLAMRSFIKRNTELVKTFIIRFFNCLHIVDLLINLESLVMDVFHDVGCQLFREDALTPRVKIHTLTLIRLIFIV